MICLADGWNVILFLVTRLPKYQITHKKYKNMLDFITVDILSKLEMCQYDTDAPAQGHNHPHVGILQKNEVEKKAITLKIIGRFYPKSNLTYILWLYTCV